jgi:hypothetical protein
MSTTTPSQNLRFRRAMDDLYYKVKNRDSASRLWDQLLTRGEQKKLGGEFGAAFGAGRGTIGMWTRLHGCTETRAIIDLAKILGLCHDTTRAWLLRESGECSDDPEEALEWALTNADLVLTDSPRTVYWQGETIDIDWDACPVLWDYFLTLCEAAKAGRYVDASDFGERLARDNHVKLKSRLTGHSGFPASLEGHLLALRGGRQVLDLPPDRICILQFETRNFVREYRGE